MFLKIVVFVTVSVLLASCATPEERLANHVQYQRPYEYGTSGIFRKTIYHNEDLLDDGTYEIWAAGNKVNDMGYTIDMAFMHAVELGRSLGAQQVSVYDHKLRLMCIGGGVMTTAKIFVDFDAGGRQLRPGSVFALSELEAKVAPIFATPPPDDVESKQRIFLENNSYGCPGNRNAVHPRFDELLAAG